MSAKVAVLLAMLWLWHLPIMAYPPLWTQNDEQVRKENSILKHYAEILQQMALGVPTQRPPVKKQATSVSSTLENKIKEGTKKTIPGGIREEIMEEVPIVRASKSSKPNGTKPLVSLIKEQSWPKEKLDLENAIQYTRNQDTKEQARTNNSATVVASGNPENANKDYSDWKNTNLKDTYSHALETYKLDSGDEAENSGMKKAVTSTVELTVKMAGDPNLQPVTKTSKKLSVKPPVNVAPKPVLKVPAKGLWKASQDSALKLTEETSQQLKPAIPGKGVKPGQMALVAPFAMSHPGLPMTDLGTGIFQPTEEDKEQWRRDQAVEDLILRKISDINTEIKHALKNTKYHIEFKDDVESAQNYLIQSLALVDRENSPSNENKPQKLIKEKDENENLRLFINFLYDFRSELTAFLNISKIPFDLQEKAAIVFNIIEEMLCGNKQKKENVIKGLLEENIRMLNMLNITAKP
ncbi:sperm equatorial segment protein 1 [Sarcophilus harrisii]|uniref:sperm equatorial segment protein 1 n=1 Tax=Sarcophilus harrisii TaxID=9305 RepID=UPI00062B35B9|nr:sperm equatorial segment protein 1 [Sarcophilus harrisii]